MIDPVGKYQTFQKQVINKSTIGVGEAVITIKKWVLG